MKRLDFYTTIAASILAVSCGETNFSGKSSKHGASPRSASPLAESATSGTGADGRSQDSSAKEGGTGELGPFDSAGDPSGQTETGDQGEQSSDDRAVASCLKKWGAASPFGQSPNYRKIAAAITILGGGAAISDTDPTSTPELVVIDAAVSVLGHPEYDLLNPNGWYCMKVDVDVLSKPVINLDCSAHLADNKVSVNVLSKGASTAASVGVAVLSEMTLNRVGACASAKP